MLYFVSSIQRDRSDVDRRGKSELSSFRLNDVVVVGNTHLPIRKESGRDSAAETILILRSKIILSERSESKDLMDPMSSPPRLGSSCYAL